MNDSRKRPFLVIGIICAIPIGFMLLITSREAVPERAKFLVNTDERYVVPRPVDGESIFHPLPGKSDDVLMSFDDTVTWGELKRSDHPYHNFGLPSTAEWDAFEMYGAKVSMVESLLSPPPSRWDDEGNWRY